MISTAVVLAEYLVDQSVFTAPASETTWPLYKSSMPDGDNVEANLGVIYDTEGLKDGRLMSNETIYHQGIQVRVRADGYEVGRAKARQVVALFEQTIRQTVTVDSVDYVIQSISQVSSILPLGPEDGTNRRDLFTVNFLVTIKES